MESYRTSATCIRLENAETLVLYTDGVTEANDYSEAEFGIDRLKSSISGSIDGVSAEKIRGTLGAIDGFHGSAARNDDLRIMALKFVG